MKIVCSLVEGSLHHGDTSLNAFLGYFMNSTTMSRPESPRSASGGTPWDLENYQTDLWQELQLISVGALYL